MRLTVSLKQICKVLTRSISECYLMIDVNDAPTNQGMPRIAESENEVTQLCPTLCHLMDCSLPGSSVHRIFQAIVLEWIAISFSRGTSQPRDRTRVSHIASRFFTEWANGEVQEYWVGSLSLLQGNLPDPGIKLGSPAFRVDSLPAELPLPVVEPGLLNQSDSLSNWSITFEICSFA